MKEYKEGPKKEIPPQKLKVCEGRISSKFGYRTHPVTGEKTSFHNGIDIACPSGTIIRTPVDCEVKAAYSHKTGGNSLIIKDIDSNDRYGFAHLSKFVCKVGDTVKKGDVIALSGNTGASTGPHLHFTYSINGKWNGNVSTGHEFVDPTERVDFEV